MTKDNKTTATHHEINWDNVTGPVAIRMTNDYLFRALMQQNNNVLKALISSLLHLNMKDIYSVKITNPIELGESIDAKEFILDIKVELNEYTVINLEMQVINEGDWPERSLCYLCRAFDNLNRGETYTEVKPVIQIGILDFTLFKDDPAFYATYHLRNDRTHKLYSDKLCISVLNLSHISMATDEDKHYHIDHWAKLFKATTWEELKMLAKSDKHMAEATSTIYQLTQEEKIRQRCEAVEDYYRRTAGREALLAKRTEELQQANADREQLNLQVKQLNANNKQLNADNKQLNADNKQLNADNKQLNADNKQLNAELEHLMQILAEHGIDSK